MKVNKHQPKIYPKLFECPVEDLFSGTLKDIAGRFGCSSSHIAKIRKVRTGRYHKVYSHSGVPTFVYPDGKYKRVLRKLNKEIIESSNLKVYGNKDYKPTRLEKPYYKQVDSKLLSMLIE